ncbi:MarR family winged helix-turn-helix transcriptional regulator [Herbidospora mongoliensis]|uniref:MarR family winged helix-turn-helix transcriptional regulator n=1 Tax=Herbidospora mongoliensis TaxID=688067 RepID=UPI00082E492E|nr:MarR family transcriptional regulator [Herbidospora mongoliensis]
MADLTDHQAAAWTSYQRMRVRLSGVLGRELARTTGLSEADFDVLVAVHERPDDSVRALALRCGLEWEKSRLSHQLRRMEQRGLITRETCEEDSRGSVVRLTPRGRELACEARKHYDEAVQRYVMDSLTPEQLSALAEIADTLLDRIEITHK